MAEKTVDMSGRVVLITGATDGIGLATAHALAGMGAHLILHGRDSARVERTVRDVQAQSGNENIDFVLGDYASLESVRMLAEAVRRTTPRLDVLINNVGAIFPTYRETVDSIEQTMAVNHLAPFLLTNLLLDLLKVSAPARIVTVSSGAHRREQLNFDDLYLQQGYEVWAAYGRSKLMNVLFTRELARQLDGTGVTANALSPGLVHTEFGVKDGMGPEQQELMNRGAPPEEGARTSIYLASSPDVAGVSGGYFSSSAPAEESEAARDDAAARRLWEISARLAGLAPFAG